MHKVKIFPQERDDGLKEAIESNASIAYVSQLYTAEPSDEKKVKDN